MPKFRKGDRITIEATVAADYVLDSGKIKIEIEPYHDFFVHQDNITMLRPEFKVGDHIVWPDGDESYAGHVLSIANDHLWVDMGAGNYATVWADNAMRVDPEPEETSEAA